MKEKDIETALGKQIYEGLKNVTSANSPIVWGIIQTEKGYKRIEQMIIEKMINQNIIVSAAIPQLEMELSE